MIAIGSRVRELLAPGVSFWLLGLCLVAVGGCGRPQAQFSTNQVYVRYQERQTGADFDPQQVQNIVNALTAMFGTPDNPFLVSGVEGLDEVVDLNRLQLAAGPVSSDQLGQGRGLYRQHCVHCHGITGDGRGPTAAFLNPYPRDFRLGTYKFKSTPIGYKPTDDDLRRVLLNGVAGTAMPSFKLLSEGDIEALINYVKYLSIRGEVERRLIQENEDFFDAEADDPQVNQDLQQEFFSRSYLVDEVLSSVVQSWSQAEMQITEIPERPSQYDRSSEEFDPEALQASVERGRKMYYTNVANCFSCHGSSQLGDGQVTDYDNWTKEFFDWTRKSDENYNARLEEYLSLGGLPPRNILPRNLRVGVYRGGRRPVDVFWRIHNGIDGTPMPESNKVALSTDDLWDLVNYVMSLPDEDASRPGVELPTNRREVQ
jgi:mono/diheme cytochrome c family protein